MKKIIKVGIGKTPGMVIIRIEFLTGHQIMLVFDNLNAK